MNDSVDKIVKERICEWGVDEKTKDALKKTYIWLKCVQDEDRALYLKLLSNFKYYSLQKMHTVLGDLYSQFKCIEKKYENTLYLPLISHKGIHNHSYDVRSCFQSTSAIDKRAFPTEMKKVIDTYPLDEIENVVFLDDMTGSGNTIKNSILYMYKEFSELFTNKNIYLIIIEACPDGLNKINELNDEIGIKIHFIYHNIHKKAFDPNFIFDSKDAGIARNKVKTYETSITKNNTEYILGFEQSEALMAFYYDTPNNTLSSFWWENQKIGWQPLFPRKKSTKPNWLNNIKQNKKTQSFINYQLAKNKV